MAVAPRLRLVRCERAQLACTSREHPTSSSPRPAADMRSVLQLGALLLLLPGAAGHGAIVSPRSRNSIDYLAGISGVDDCRNLTGAPCENGQAAHWYSQGCFIGCPTCDHESGRRQVLKTCLAPSPLLSHENTCCTERVQQNGRAGCLTAIAPTVDRPLRARQEVDPERQLPAHRQPQGRGWIEVRHLPPQPMAQPGERARG